MNLWPHQVSTIDRLRAAMRAGKRRVVCVMPTGAGKTRTASEVVLRSVSAGKYVLWFVHRAELVDQAVRTLQALGLTVGAISASAATPPNPFAQVQVATIQTLLSRNLRPRADLIIADEAHHYVSDEWIALVRDYHDALVIGLTATPERSDGRGLGELFDALVVGTTVKELTASGHLVPCDIRHPPKPLGPGEIAQNPVDAYVQHAMGRQAVLFARGVELAESYAQEFVMRGISARCIHGSTPWAERSLYIDAFRAGSIQVLTNVFVLTEGFDAPNTSCVILARGCTTPGTYLQMVGRALRCAPNKKDAILLDLRGVSHELGAPDADRIYSLDGEAIALKDKNSYCPVCGQPRIAGEGCEACGWQPAGDTIGEDVVTGGQLVKFAAKRAETDDKKFATLCRWLKQARAKHYKQGWLQNKWKAVYDEPLSITEIHRAQAVIDEEVA